MTAKECYEKIGGNYEEVLGRLMNEERIRRFAGMFLSDESFAGLRSAMEAKDYDQAFRMAHTLKGVSQNLSLAALYEAVNEITEALRETHRDVELAEHLYPSVQEQYERTCNGIRELLA